MASVRWTVSGTQDLAAIADYLTPTSPSYAAALSGRIIDAIDRLLEYPRMGRVLPEYDDDRVRELIVASYRIVYALHGEVVLVIGILHGSRDLLGILGDNPLERS